MCIRLKYLTFLIKKNSNTEHAEILNNENNGNLRKDFHSLQMTQFSKSCKLSLIRTRCLLLYHDM